MFTQAELLEKKKVEVMSIAKDLGLPRYKGKSELPKEEIIHNIMEAQKKDEVDETNDKKITQVSNEDNKIVKYEAKKSESKVVKEVKKLQKPRLSDEEKAAKKQGYIDGAKVGTLVAFRADNGKVKSAMIIKRSTKNRKFKLETSYGAKFIVSFDDIIWVRTNKRWPKGVYQLLKGIEEDTTEVE